MGYYDAWQRTRLNRSGGGGNSSGFSASRYFSRNAASAKSFLAPPARQAGTGQQLDTRRPYADVGKSSINLFGRPVTPKSPELAAMPGAFQSGEDQGGPLGFAARALGELGKLPVPFGALSPAYSAFQAEQKRVVQETVNGNAEDYRRWASAHDATGEGNWMTNTRLMTEFAREHLVQTGKMSLLQGSQAMTPVDENLGGFVQSTLQGLGVMQQYVQRGIAETGADQRLKTLLEQSDEELENIPELIRIRDEHRKYVQSGGREGMSKNDALDSLVIEGHGVTEPVGQSKPIQFIRSIGDNTPLDVPFDIVANFTAGAISLGLEVVTDPASILSLGGAAGIRQAGKGAAKAMVRLVNTRADEALEDAVTKGVVKRGTEAADDVVKQASYAERQRLGGFLPKGVANTDMNLMRYALAADDPAAKAAMQAVGRVQRPFVANQHVLGWMQKAENVLDPLSLFGSDRMGRLANKSVALHLVDGVTNSLGKHNFRPVMQALEQAGVNTERISGDIGTAIANIGAQVGGESVAHHHVRLGIGVEDATDPTVVSDLGRDMLQRHGQTVESLARHKMDKVKALPRQVAGESVKSAIARERKFAANLLVKMYGLDENVALGITAKMGEGQLAVVRFMQYGNMADGLLNTRAASYAEGAAMGLSKEFIDRVIFLGPTQLTKAKALAIREAMSSVPPDIGAIRQAVGQYDVLEWNLSQALDDIELVRALDELLDGIEPNLPRAFEPSEMTPSMRAFKEKFGDSMELGLRGESVFATGRNQAGRITSVDPFMDYVRGADVGIGDIKPANAVRAQVSRLTNSISGSQVVIEQNRRFAQAMAERAGLTREQSDQLMHLIRQQAAEHDVSSARGLYYHELNKALTQVQLPPTLKSKMSVGEIQKALFFAHEGSWGKVGLSQKFTGRLKSIEVNRFGGNRLGVLAERYYPNVRFKWNLFFQLQESIETPVLLIARGMASPQQFSGPATGVRAGVREALRSPGERRAAFRRGKTAEVERLRDIDYQTAVMMDAFVGGLALCRRDGRVLGHGSLWVGGGVTGCVHLGGQGAHRPADRQGRGSPQDPGPAHGLSQDLRRPSGPHAQAGVARLVGCGPVVLRQDGEGRRPR